MGRSSRGVTKSDPKNQSDPNNRVYPLTKTKDTPACGELHARASSAIWHCVKFNKFPSET